MPNMRDLSFATVNLFNLQVPGGITYNDEPQFADNAEGRESYENQVSWMANRVALLDADVLGFQELWAAEALENVFAKAGLGADYDLIARDAPGRGQPQVALAIRKDRHGESTLLDGADWIASFPDTFKFEGLREEDGASEEITITIDKFSRPVLRAQIQPQGRNPKPPVVNLFVAHLKSKGPARLSFAAPRPIALQEHSAITKSAVSHVRRVMEAGALRALLDPLMKEEDDDDLSPVVVMGDLNDSVTSVTNELLSNQPSYRVIEKSTAGGRSDKGLYSAERLQQLRSQRDVYYSYIYKNKLESLDHVMVSEEFYDHSRKRQWSFRETEVFNDHLNRKAFKKDGAPDHGQIKACFDWNPMPEATEAVPA